MSEEGSVRMVSRRPGAERISSREGPSVKLNWRSYRIRTKESISYDQGEVIGDLFQSNVWILFNKSCWGT